MPEHLVCSSRVCVAGLVVAYVSDTTLHNFVVAKKHSGRSGKPQQQLLQTGSSAKLLPVTAKPMVYINVFGIARACELF